MRQRGRPECALRIKAAGVAGLAVIAAASAGCGVQAPASSRVSAPATDRLSPPAGPETRRAPWPQRVVLRESSLENGASQVIDVANQVAYLLVSRSSNPIRGPWVLRRIDLATGSVRPGPTFRQMSLTWAAGYLWVAGRGSGQVPPGRVSQIDPRTLAVVRTIEVPRGSATLGWAGSTIAAGPGNSVWIGLHRTLIRVSAATGKVLTSATVPAGLAVVDISVDPGLRFLYVSAARVVSGGLEGNVVLEYGATSGRRLAIASHGPVTYSVVGSALTAVPGGVWVSFRTGMLGLTLHLRQRDLRLMTPPGLNQGPGVFHWAMYATTAYGGGALWLANQEGIVACIDPGTAAVRARETVSQSRLVFQFIAVDPVAHMLYVATNAGLVAIRPPQTCWARR
jgi:hypothetical protein